MIRIDLLFSGIDPRFIVDINTIAAVILGVDFVDL